MSIEFLMKDYVAYNLWANTKIAHWLQAKPAELLYQEVASSFPNLRTTLLHCWSAQDIWLSRLKGSENATLVSETFKGSTEEMLAGLLENSADFNAFIGSRSSDYFEQKTRYVHRNTVTYEQFNVEIIQHCIQHSTYHRGQVVTIARSVGITDTFSTDYITYSREVRANSIP